MFEGSMGVIEGGPRGVTVFVQVGKVGNGYTVHLRTYPKRPAPPSRPPVEGSFEGLDPDQAIDKMVDGVGALIRSINDRGAGEVWKSGEDRQAIREVVKAIFPAVALAGRPQGPPVGDYEQARSEDLVFESKGDLLAYLSENL